MLAVIIFVVLFNCFPAKENGGYKNTSYKFVGSDYGNIKGHLASDGDYFAFLGIPYAAPPIGINRFKGPIPPAPWEGTYDAFRSVKCPQRGEGDEDCLVLNVFTPLQPANSLLPVLFYIHGGAFLLGSGPIDGMEPFIKQNIIVVTINYRLGALGFLCLGIKEAPGNAGLKDQVAALKWVHENIVYFGGDAKLVTIYGMGAGGASVEYLVLSKAAKGLFAQAIMESASATSVWAIDADPITTARKVGKILDLPEIKCIELLVKFYKTMDIDILTDTNFNYYNNLTDGTSGFVPCVERKLGKVKPFITVSPQKILEGEKYRKVPMMILFTSLEGLFRSAQYYGQNYKERMDLNFLDFMPADLIFMKEKFRVETGRNVRQFYFGNSSIGNSNNIIQYFNYFGDCLILHAMLSSCDAHSRGGNTVYLMEFSYKGGLGIREGFFEFVNAAGHGDVVQYTILEDTPKNEMDKLTVRRVTSLIGNFVKYRDPTPSKTSLHPITWPPVQPGNLTYLYLDKEFQVDYNPYEERIEMWDKLYAKFRRPVKPVGSP